MYWFMFPLAIGIATIAMLCGIAGAALFMPVFLLVFPLLGAEYEINDPMVSVAAALMTSTFGFSSGFIAYSRQGLIDFKQALAFLKIAMPLAICGVLICSMLSNVHIRLAYGVLAILMGFFLLKNQEESQIENTSSERKKRTIQSRDGTVYQYFKYRPKIVLTALGGFLTGLLSTGIGEVVMPQLIKKGKVPVPIAAGTSVFIVVSVFFLASSMHAYMIIKSGGINAIPWNLVCYTIPGVIIGGQIGPRLQGKFSQQKMIKGIAIVFCSIGLLMFLASI